ncbi:MAG: hypothetical protein ACYDBJ_21245 [Aggregatilineales bacterium]
MSPEQAMLPLDDFIPPAERADPSQVEPWKDLPVDDTLLDWNWEPPIPNALEMALPADLRATLQAELADLERQIEIGAEEMNTLEGMERLERLEEDRAGVFEELVTQFPTRALLEANSTLVDARFMSRTDLDAEGSITSYTVQAIALYQDMNDELVGLVLDVGRYEDEETAAETFEALQDGVTGGAITLNQVSLLAEAIAEEGGLDKHDWQTMTPADLARYEYQRISLDVPTPDLPSDSLAADAAFVSRLFNATMPDPETTAQEQATLVNAQALAALRGIGLDVPQPFDLSRDSFYDPNTDERVINSVFQANPDDPTRNCRPLFVSLSAGQEGLSFQAQAVEFGQTGSLADAQRVQEQVQVALEAGGIGQALTAIEALEAPPLEMAPAMPANSRWSRDID